MLRKKNLVGAVTATVLAGSLGVLPAAAAHAAPTAPVTQVAAAAPVTETTKEVTGTLDGAPFAGEISNLTVQNVDGVPTLSGVLTGTGLPADGTEFTAPITGLAVEGDNGACEILNLDLGPLDLNLLGLDVDLNQVQLDITAVPGAGNLLGNLLCSVAGLLDRNGGLDGLGGALNGVVALVNRLLTGLGL